MLELTDDRIITYRWVLDFEEAEYQRDREVVLTAVGLLKCVS